MQPSAARCWPSLLLTLLWRWLCACAARTVSRNPVTPELVGKWRFTIASLFETELCSEDDAGACLDEWNDGDGCTARRLRPVPGQPGIWFRLKVARLRDRTVAMRTWLCEWAMGRYAPENTHPSLLRRIEHHRAGCNAEATPSQAFHARRVYVESPRGVIDPDNEAYKTWVDQIEIALAEVLLQCKFAFLQLALAPDGRDEPSWRRATAADDPPATSTSCRSATWATTLWP